MYLQNTILDNVICLIKMNHNVNITQHSKLKVGGVIRIIYKPVLIYTA